MVVVCFTPGWFGVMSPESSVSCVDLIYDWNVMICLFVCFVLYGMYGMVFSSLQLNGCRCRRNRVDNPTVRDVRR